jgi:hypothetical protein
MTPTIPQSIWTNLKNGQRYRVLYHARDCTNARDGTVVVVYVPAEQATTPSRLYVRELREFLTKFSFEKRCDDTLHPEPHETAEDTLRRLAAGTPDSVTPYA